MGIIDSLAERRSFYSLNRELPVTPEKIAETVKRVTELVPDAFNCRSARVVLLLGEKHDSFWNRVFEVFDGKLAREKSDSFRAGAGTILFFYDENVVKGLQENFPLYAANFPLFARDANGMLQICMWTALRELGLGASLQHYNPVIDEMVRELCAVPQNWRLISQMPFGGIAGPAKVKDTEDISLRVKVLQ